jgi:hypothetical protein
MKFAITFVVEADSEKALRDFLADTTDEGNLPDGVSSVLVVGVAQAIEVEMPNEH